MSKRIIRYTQVNDSETPNTTTQQTIGNYTHENQFPWGNPKICNTTPYLKAVTNVLPNGRDAASKCKIPYGFILSPTLIENVQTVEPIKFPFCSCGAYLCPQMKITNNGDSFTCGICGKTSKIPKEIKLHNRPELSNSVYDIILPDNPKFNNPIPLFLFIIDMSYPTYITGFTTQFLHCLKSSIPSIPDDYRIGLMTITNVVTIFNLKTQSQIIISDFTEPPFFVHSEIFPYKSECIDNFTSSIDYLLKNPPNESIKGHCLFSSLCISELLLRQTGGIIISSFSNVPRYGGGLLHPLNDTSDEYTQLMLPKDGSGRVYRTIGFKLSRAQVSVYMFTIGNEDISNVAIPCGLTCGRLYCYEGLTENEINPLNIDLFNTLTNRYYWGSSLRFMSSKGIRLLRVHTNCSIRDNGLIVFPVFPYNNSIVFELSVEINNISNEAIFQIIFSFVNNSGKRFLRVFTFSFPTSNVINNIWNNINEDAFMTLISRIAISAILSRGPNKAFEYLKQDFIKMLNLGIPFVSMNYLFHSLLVNPTFNFNKYKLGADGRMGQLINCRNMNLNDLLLYLYPKMYVLDSDEIKLLPLCGDSFKYGNCFLFHTYDKIYLWVSKNVNTNFLLNTFGTENINGVPQKVPELDTFENKNLKNLINECWKFSGRYLDHEIIVQGSEREYVFEDILVDDSPRSGETLQQWTKQMKII